MTDEALHYVTLLGLATSQEVALNVPDVETFAAARALDPIEAIVAFAILTRWGLPVREALADVQHLICAAESEMKSILTFARDQHDRRLLGDVRVQMGIRALLEAESIGAIDRLRAIMEMT